jgi:hypothetical protein
MDVELDPAEIAKLAGAKGVNLVETARPVIQRVA